MSGAWSGCTDTTKCARNLWKCVAHHQGWMFQLGMGVIWVYQTKWWSKTQGCQESKTHIRLLVSVKRDYLTSFLYLHSRLLVYFKARLQMKVSLSPWSITSQEELNSLTISQILTDPSLTGYPQGPAQADQPDWMIAVSSVSVCTGSPSAFLPFARREQHKTTSTGF